MDALKPTPRRLTLILRLSGLAASIGLSILLLGPFQGAETALGLTDKEAHAIGFFGLTLGLFALAPNRRRTDLALVAIFIGVVVELLQGLTGRSLSLADLGWDAIGVAAATLPGLIERLRFYLREETASASRPRGGALSTAD